MIKLPDNFRYEEEFQPPPNSKPVIVDKKIWEIAKKGMPEDQPEYIQWATVVKLYREMGGRIEFRPMDE